MGMPPPLEPERDDDEDTDTLHGIDVTGLIEKAKKLGISDYIYAIGAGIVAFREQRKRRQDHDIES